MIFPRFLLSVCLSAALLRWLPSSAPSGAELEGFTGAHTRVVWMRDTSDELRAGGYGDGYLLMALDSRDDKGPRLVLPQAGSYFRPLITPDGAKIVFTDSLKREVWIVNWDGSGLRSLRSGTAGAVWRDAEGVDWVYGKDAFGAEAKDLPLIRYRLDNPTMAEVVWDKSESEVVAPGNLQLSRGGSAASLTLPWPSCGVALLGQGSWTPLGDGCWPSVAPDGSLVSWVFDGSHRHLTMREPREGREWRIELSDAPGINKYRTYHPRWSNHPLFMAMTGPYLRGKKNPESIPDIYVGKFKNDLSAIEEWFRVTASDAAEIFPDVWVEGGAQAKSALDHGEESEAFSIAAPELDDEWPASSDGLLFLWKNQRVGSRPAGDSFGGKAVSVVPTGASRYGPAHELVLRGSGAEVSGDKDLAERIASAGALTVELVVMPALAEQDGVILLLGPAGSSPVFSLVQRCGELFALPGGGRAVAIGLLPAGRKTHVLVSCADGKITAYLDGRTVVSAAEAEIGKASWPPDVRLHLGGAEDQHEAWAGTLEGVAIYGRAIGPEEAAKQASLFAEILAKRPARETWGVEAELMEREQAPDAAEVAPYRRALVVNTYRLIDSELPVGDGEFRLAEWAMLDGEEPVAYRELRPGDRRRLRLERFEDNPQLESERLVSDEVDFELFVESELSPF